MVSTATNDLPQNIFVLCTGRCGSVTFAKACEHFTNFTSGHETRSGLLGADRFAYPVRHIEADNRLSWLLGRLDAAYGDNAFYVHLTRNRVDTANSFSKRADRGIMKAYQAPGILMHLDRQADPMQVALDYVDTVTENIRHFLRDKQHVMEFALENSEAAFPVFCERIGAQGDLAAALSEFSTRHNAGA